MIGSCQRHDPTTAHRWFPGQSAFRPKSRIPGTLAPMQRPVSGATRRIGAPDGGIHGDPKHHGMPRPLRRSRGATRAGRARQALTRRPRVPRPRCMTGGRCFDILKLSRSNRPPQIVFHLGRLELTQLDSHALFLSMKKIPIVIVFLHNIFHVAQTRASRAGATIPVAPQTSSGRRNFPLHTLHRSALVTRGNNGGPSMP
jgi:hypothetical protein